MFSVKMSLIPEDGVLEEKNLTLAFKELELEAPFVGPGVEVNYELSRIQDGPFLAKVRASAAMNLGCSRCLADFEMRADAEFVSRFELKSEREESVTGLGDPELSVVFFEGERLPMGEEIRQEMLLKIPFVPLCRPECKGLCPICGGDKNRQSCDCESEPKNNPFKDLKKLFNQS